MTPITSPVLRTPRLLLVPVEDPVTVAQAFQLVSMPDIRVGLGFPVRMDLRQFGARLKAKKPLRCLLMQTHGHDQPVGMVSYWENTPFEGTGELLYAVHPEHRGEGYALEACRALFCELFQGRALQGMGALVAPENRRSQSILTRLGMSPVGHSRGKQIYYYVTGDAYKATLVDRLVRGVDWSRSGSHLLHLAALLYGVIIRNLDL